MVDHVLVMTVNPGFGGQAYIPTMLNKIREIRNFIIEKNLNVDIEVDGGIKANWTFHNVPMLVLIVLLQAVECLLTQH